MYIAAGLVVLVAGTIGLLSMRGGAAVADGVVIEAGEGMGSAGGSAFGDVAAAVDFFGATVSSSSTSTTQVRRIWVQVAGAVRRPGVYEVSAGSRVFQAVVEAGGFSDDADEEAVALAAELSDGCRVYVPRKGESAAGPVQSPAQSSAGITGGATGGASQGGPVAGPVSLNSSTLEELDALPGIGPSLAQQIISYRESQGPFTSVDQLTDVPGIGPAKLEQLRPLVGL
ncbi:MAG: hypothetical protein A2133_06775 [Actinobacteria bacterium RBG_16_64_13]|nr:MAG: hypothetical protein A2133_06775 [Actinobacteria bacterium RBG_16_64_13]